MCVGGGGGGGITHGLLSRLFVLTCYTTVTQSNVTYVRNKTNNNNNNNNKSQNKKEEERIML